LYIIRNHQFLLLLSNRT